MLLRSRYTGNWDHGRGLSDQNGRVSTAGEEERFELKVGGTVKRVGLALALGDRGKIVWTRRSPLHLAANNLAELSRRLL